MATELRLRGGTTAQHASFTGATKEITVDTTKNTVVVHDGSTAGGYPLLNQTDLNNTLTSTSTEQALTAAQGKVLKDEIDDIVTGNNNLTGVVQFFARNTAPDGWLKANGAEISRTTYAALFAAIGTTFGAGNGSTTFNLPDMRGEFPRGWDDGRGVDSGRSFGTAQGDAIRNITGTLGWKGTEGFGNGAHFNAGTNGYSNSQGISGSGRSIGFDASRVVPTANENRSRNIALLACIKF